MAPDRPVDVDAELDRLYGLPLDEFTKARNDLSARLKKAGAPDAAAEVKALPKPSVPAWAVNQLARTRKREVRALLDAAERSRTGKAKTLREALDEQRDALSRLTHQARELLEAGRGSAPEAMVQRVASTLRAAASDPAGAELLERGRVTEDLEPAGFEALAGVVSARPAAPTPKRDDRQKRIESAQKAVRDRKAEVAELHNRADEAKRQAGRARKAADRADRALAEAEQELRRVGSE